MDDPLSHGEELASLWYEHAPDEQHGGFHTTLSRRWEPVAPRHKLPAMIGRQVFGFSTAYLLSGEPRYLKRARRGVRYLHEFGWDEKYGGWYDRLTEGGNPDVTEKSVQTQLYTNVGLLQYYFVTGESDVLDTVRRSIEIRRSHGHDERHGGYYEQLGRDLRVSDTGKNKHAHYGYVGSLLLDLFLATREKDVLEWERSLCDLSIDRHTNNGWIYGFGTEFDREWDPTRKTVDGEPVVSIGAGLAAARAFLRLYYQTGRDTYLEAGRRVADNVYRHGWDDRGFFWDWLGRDTLDPTDGAGVARWIQIYGCFLGLLLYHATGEKEYRRRSSEAESFYRTHMVDDEHGGVFPTVEPDGTPTDTRKARPWKTSYHELEFEYRTHLYRGLFVRREPVTLHFRIDGDGENGTRYVCPVDDPEVGIARVAVDRERWSGFDATERSVSPPTGDGGPMTVTLSPPKRS